MKSIDKKSRVVLVAGSHEEPMTQESIERFMETEEYQLTFPRKINLEANGNSRVLDFLLDNGFIALKDIPPEARGDIAVAVFRHAKGAFSYLQNFNLPSIDERLLNAKNSELVTQEGAAAISDPLQLKSRYFFSLELKMLEESGYPLEEAARKDPDVRESAEIVLTEDGVFLWTSRYRRTPGMAEKYPKNLTSKERFLAELCQFKKLDSATFTEVFRDKPELFLNIIHRAWSQVRQQIGELTRLKTVMEEQSKKIGASIMKIHWK